MSESKDYFNIDEINSCIKNIETDLKEIEKGNQTAIKRVRRCLLDLAHECKGQRVKLMDKVKEIRLLKKEAKQNKLKVEK